MLPSRLVTVHPEKSIFSRVFCFMLIIPSLSIPAFVILLGVNIGVEIG